MESFVKRIKKGFYNKSGYCFLFLAIAILFLNLNIQTYVNKGLEDYTPNINLNNSFYSTSFNKINFWGIQKQDTTSFELRQRMPHESRGIYERNTIDIKENESFNQNHSPSTSFTNIQTQESEKKESNYFEFETASKLNNSDFTQEDLYWLARVVHAEAPGDIDEGQIAVANVVLNRLNSGWARTIKDVIFQRINGTFQFTPVENGTIYISPSRRAVNNAIRALNGERMVPKNVYYFYMPASYNQNDWIRTRPIYRQIGIHRFCF